MLPLQRRLPGCPISCPHDSREHVARVLLITHHEFQKCFTLSVNSFAWIPRDTHQTRPRSLFYPQHRAHCLAHSRASVSTLGMNPRTAEQGISRSCRRYVPLCNAIRLRPSREGLASGRSPRCLQIRLVSACRKLPSMITKLTGFIGEFQPHHMQTSVS